MPGHLHLVVPSAPRLEERLRRTLAWHTRKFGPVDRFRLWEPIPLAAPIADRLKLARQVRYVVLNPCRAGLADDPLDWVWSTYRDVIGATVEPWVDADRLARVLGRSGPGFVRQHHHYVSTDPSVAVGGTPPPEPARADWLASLGDVAEAVGSALRIPAAEVGVSAVGRRLFVHLATRHGWADRKHLADALGITNGSVWRLLQSEPEAQAMAAAALCLGDRRLRSVRR
ncbi:MAG: hypothetical protein GY898_08790 [Proteobacteria bacterium]|nr:hypothetical protein [Pseudomonadota bacterium]